MARNPGNSGEKTKKQRILEREEALRGALPQRLAFQRLFGRQFVLPCDQPRRASKAGATAREQSDQPVRQLSLGLRPLPTRA
jgi:hypothetical protein